MSKDTFDPYAPLGGTSASAKPASDTPASTEKFDPYAPLKIEAEPEPAADQPRVARPVSELIVSPEGEINPVPLAGATGALTAGLASRILSNAQADKVPSTLVNARATAAGANAALEAARTQASQAGAVASSQADALKTALDAARAQADEARRVYDEARIRAARVGAIPEALNITNAPPVAAIGTSASPEGLTQGALRHAEKAGEVIQANAVRKGAAPLSGYSQSSRLIVPNELVGAPIYNTIQKSAQTELALAEEAMRNAAKNFSTTQAQWQKATGAAPRAVATATNRLAGQETVASKASARLKALEEAYPGISAFPTVLRMGLSMIGGGLSAAELTNAYLQAKEGKMMDAATSAAGGVGGAMMLSGDPRRALMGAVISSPALATQIPKLYEEYIQPRLFPYKSVMNE
jgi:hypothetical protein